MRCAAGPSGRRWPDGIAGESVTSPAVLSGHWCSRGRAAHRTVEVHPKAAAYVLVVCKIIDYNLASMHYTHYYYDEALVVERYLLQGRCNPIKPLSHYCQWSCRTQNFSRCENTLMSVTIPLVCLLHRYQQLPLITNVFFLPVSWWTLVNPPQPGWRTSSSASHLYYSWEPASYMIDTLVRRSCRLSRHVCFTCISYKIRTVRTRHYAIPLLFLLEMFNPVVNLFILSPVSIGGLPTVWHFPVSADRARLGDIHLSFYSYIERDNGIGTMRN